MVMRSRETKASRKAERGTIAAVMQPEATRHDLLSADHGL